MLAFSADVDSMVRNVSLVEYTPNPLSVETCTLYDVGGVSGLPFVAQVTVIAEAFRATNEMDPGTAGSAHVDTTIIVTLLLVTPLARV